MDSFLWCGDSSNQPFTASAKKVSENKLLRQCTSRVDKNTEGNIPYTATTEKQEKFQIKENNEGKKNG
jgi:hypothetical protein